MTPRPRHFKQDKTKIEEFKKNITKEIARYNSHLLFFDESRFGTHSKIGYGWFKRGTRTTVKVGINRENFYLYSAVDTSNGDNFSIILPSVNTNNMNVFLLELSKLYPTDTLVLIMDGAGWHKSRSLKVPNNIKIIYLPPYSPELNPVEKLWLYIKSKLLVNKLYECINALEAILCEFIKTLSADIIKTLCSISYLLT